MALTDYEITLDDDYKAIVAILFSEFTSTPTVTLTLEDNTFENKFISDYYKAYMSGTIVFDLNVQKKKGEKYTVKYRSRYSSNTSPMYWLKVYGIK